MGGGPLRGDVGADGRAIVLSPHRGEASAEHLAGRELQRSPSTSPSVRIACASIGQDYVACSFMVDGSISWDPQGHHRDR
jgi:hypothetical protein